VTTDVEERLRRLESLVDEQRERLDDQQDTIERQRERIAELESENGRDSGDTRADPVGESPTSVGGGTALKGAGLLGLLGVGVGRAAANPQGQVGTAESPVETVYTETLAGGLTDRSAVETLAGEGLSISGGALVTDGDSAPVSVSGSVGDSTTGVSELVFDRNLSVDSGGDGSVTVSATDTNTDTDTHTDVSEDGSTVVSDTDDIDFGDNLDVTESGGGATVDADVRGATSWTESGGLLRAPGYGGIDVDEVRTDALTDRDDGTDPVTLGTDVDLDGNALADGTATLWDPANEQVPVDRLEHDSLEVAAGTGLQNGGSVALGGSTTLDVSVADLAGNALEDDGTDSLAVGSAGIGTDELAANAVTSDEIAGSGTVQSRHIAENAVTRADLFGVSVSRFKMDSGVVTTDKLADGAVGADKIWAPPNGSGVTAPDLAASFEFQTLFDGPLTQFGTIRAEKLVPPDDTDLKMGGSGGTVTCRGRPLRPPDAVEGALLPSGDHSLGGEDDRWETLYVTSKKNLSDARLKENVTELSDGRERLAGIRPVAYERADREDADTRLGFVAQELADAVPEAVSRPEDDGHYFVEYDMVVPVAVAAIQRQEAEIERLEDERDRLEDERESLRAATERLRERIVAAEARLGADG
jgi:hypothetical protein